MKNIIMILIGMSFVGCASIQERCHRPEMLEQYESVQACAADLRAQNRAQSAALEQAGRDFNQNINAPYRTPAQVQCVSTPDLITGQLRTNCSQ